ncbi:nucleoside deaminase [Metarhizium rileyi]|uniref:Nucleoside deaminase n=1 Tax=Metarhizium rileyi (strain RCEF 4871) TaxID=1649241 RepID=A0A167ECV9_METRR|nr:nucleoside deaminase [Metarhizium rileyi RCEF 4871]
MWRKVQNIITYLTAITATGAITKEPRQIYFTADADADARYIPLSTRNHWMRRANAALFEVTGSPCPPQAFGSVIVNHTAGGLGDLVCIGVNAVESGNPTLHGQTMTPPQVTDEEKLLTRSIGEIAAINNCSALLRDPNGSYRFSGRETFEAWADLSLYTNAEPCPMCASAIRWAGFKELVFGSSTKLLIANNWTLMTLSAEELFKYTTDMRTKTAIIPDILANETDPYFTWQYTNGSECPPGCERQGSRCSFMAAGAGKDETAASSQTKVLGSTEMQYIGRSLVE